MSFRDGRKPDPQSITAADEYGFRLHGLRPRAGMTRLWITGTRRGVAAAAIPPSSFAPPRR